MTARKPNRRVGTFYFLGLDLGQVMQPSALAVIEQEVIDLPFRRGRELRALKLRYLKRFPLDASYADMGAEAARVIANLDTEEGAKPRADLIINITGTGRPVGEAMRKEDLDPIFVTVTGGSRETETSPRDWQISKNDLVGGLQVLFQDERFKVAKGMALAEEFMQELLTFKIKPPPLNPNDPESWRERPNDDLVFAVAIATWRATRYLPKPPATRDREYRAFEEYHAQTADSYSMRVPARR